MQRLIGMLIAAGAVLGGCSERVPAAADHAVRIEVTRSQKQSRGAIDVQSRVLTPVVIDRPVKVRLQLKGEGHRALWLEIAYNRDLELKGDHRRYLPVDGNPTVTETLELVPRVAGKHYLRMLVSTASGDPLQPVVVVLEVRDAQGNLPQRSKPTKERIELPARTSR